jgi:hypothetical protein
MHSDNSLNIRGNWKRWTQYEIVDGCVAAAEGAELVSYDPWEGYRANAGKYRTVQQPYCSLLQMTRRLRQYIDSDYRSSRQWSSELVTEILRWSGQHGLLGLLPVLSTRVQVSDTLRHYRKGGEWFTKVIESSDRGDLVFSQPLVDAGDVDERTTKGLHDGGAITWLNWISQDYEREPLSCKKAFFSIDHLGQFEPFRPGTSQFWKTYREPVPDFIDWCIVFANIADTLSRETKLAEEPTFLKASAVVLSQLADSCSAPSLQLYPERRLLLDEERRPAGLLASYALMLLWDLVEGRRVLSCTNCCRYFVSDEHRAAYCSPRCRNTAQSRRYRAKHSLKSHGEQ